MGKYWWLTHQIVMKNGGGGGGHIEVYLFCEIAHWLFIVWIVSQHKFIMGERTNKNMVVGMVYIEGLIGLR